ncbi:hypothetical protein RAS1_41640 [Phycisphaerae bacterium RAS1]|nr:hypothetical protein RAS1_41640 [Phycisphaerae bacterium RAS1]
MIAADVRKGVAAPGPLICELFEESRLATRLREWLGDRLPSGGDVQNVHIERCWPARDGAFRFQWSLPLGSGRRARFYGSPRNEAKHRRLAGAHSVMSRTHRRDAGAPPPGTLGCIDRGLAVRGRPYDLLIHSPDCDARLPQLAACLDPAAAGPLVRAVVSGPDGRRAPRLGRMQTRLLAFKPGRRAAILYSWRTARGTVRVIGKTHSGEAAAALTERHARVGGELERLSRGRIRIPRVIGEISAPKLLLFEYVGGREMGDVRLPTSEELDLIAETLATLHRLDPHGLPAFGAVDEVRVVQRWRDALKLARPDMHAAAAPLVGVVAELAPAAPGVACTVHRDFYGKQLLCDAAGVTLLDLDTLAGGRPEQDLGNILAHLHLNAVQTDAPARDAAAAFARLRTAYSRRRGPVDEAALRFFAVAALTRLGAVHALRTLTRRCSPVLWDVARRLAESPAPGGMAPARVSNGRRRASV